MIERGLGHVATAASLGDVLAPTHPVLAGVGTLSSNVAYRPQPATGIVQGRVLARWDDGSILAATGSMPGRVDLGMLPPSSRCNVDDWAWGTDGDVLVANALAYAAGDYGAVGASYCAAQTNSTGATGSIAAVGSDLLATDDLTLVAGDLPTGRFGLFVASLTPGLNPGAGGFSDGDVCVGGTIGRFNRPGEIRFSGDTGAFALRLDLGDLPQGATTVGAQVGETWHFQAWYRDSVGLGSNFTDAVAVTFQ